MKLSRVAVLGIALAAGLVAAVLALRLSSSPAPEPASAPAPMAQTETVPVLVATRDVPTGTTLAADAVAWHDWPKDSVTPRFITGGGDTDAVVGAITRAGFYQGEPISDAKLIHSDRGFMSAILPEGKRAVALRIAADTSAGGFILPNDHVDVIMTRRAEPNSTASGSEFLTETVLHNVRVLAIDQTIEKNAGSDTSGSNSAGDTVIGQTATLELTPQQAEIITVAQQISDRLTLALRSISDSRNSAADAARDAVHLIGGTKANGAVTIVRNGVAQQVTGIR